MHFSAIVTTLALATASFMHSAYATFDGAPPEHAQ